MTIDYELDSVPAARLCKGDRILHPDLGVFTLADRPLRLTHGSEFGRAFDRQWVTLRFVEDVPEIEVHEGDYFDKIIGEEEVS